LPSVQPYQPNFQLYAGALQMKQTQYDANRKQISNLYGSLLNSPLTRDSNVQARDEFFKTIDYEIQKLAGVDLSLQENVDTAARLFTSLYDNKNIVKDMIWTKNFQSEMDVAEGFRNCVDPEKCGGQYWDGGVQALEYKRQEFRNASDEQAMGFDDARYSPFVNVQERAAKIFKEMGWNYKPMPTMDGAWIIQTKNGEPIVGPLYAHLSAVLGQDPKIRDYYKTKSYLDRKNFASSNAQQYGSVDAAEAAYISEAQRSINDTFRQMNQEAKQESVNARGKAEDIRRGQQEGFIDKSAEIQSQMDSLFGTADKFDRFDEETSTILTSTAGTAKADLRASGDIIDQNMAALMLSQDLNNAARILAYTDYEVDIKVNEVWKMDRQHQLDKQLAAYKAQLDAEAAEKEATGPPELNELYAAAMAVDANLDPNAAFEQMRQFSAETSQVAKSTNHEVLTTIFKQAQGSANAEGGLNRTQAAEDARLIMERTLKQYKANAETNGTDQQRKQANEWLTKWNSKNKAEQIGWAKTFDINSVVDKMPYMSIHNIVSTSIGSKGQNFLESNSFNKANRQYLNNALAQLGGIDPSTGRGVGSLYEYETAYQEAQAWRDTKINTHKTVTSWLDANGPAEFRGKWNYLVDPNSSTFRSSDSFAFAYAKGETISASTDPAEIVRRAQEQAVNDGYLRADLMNGRNSAATKWNYMSEAEKAKYKSKEDFVIQTQAKVLTTTPDRVKVKNPDGSVKYINVDDFFTSNGLVKNKYSQYENSWTPASNSRFWQNYLTAERAYVEGSVDDVDNPVFGSVFKANKEQIAANVKGQKTQMLDLYKQAFNEAPIFKGGQTYQGLMGGGSTVAQGVSMFVDYKHHNSKSVLTERNFLQNAMQSTLGTEVRYGFGQGALPENTNPKALQALQTIIGEAIMGKKDSRPTWVGEYNPIGGGNQKWQQYTIKLTDPAMIKQLSQNVAGADQDAVSLYQELASSGGKITVYLKDNAANNSLHNMTKKSAMERRLDYEGTAPIAYGQYNPNLHNLKLNVMPNGYNVSGNIAVGYDGNNYQYEFINENYNSTAYSPVDINNRFVNILGNITNQLNLKPNLAYPNYVK
jgi:hypothetical protein